MTDRCVVFAANRGYALTSSRTELIRRFLDGGWNVVLATADDAWSRSLCDLGARLEPVAFSRGGLSPRADLRAFRRLGAICRRWRPAMIQHFHAKPVILGTLAARRALGDSVAVVNTVTGLGRAFTAGRLTGRLAGFGYSLGAGRSDAVIFQNRDDRALFLSRGWTAAEKAHLIAGSGVDVDRFAPAEREAGDRAPVVVMLGRLLRQKGIPEFAEVARRVRYRRPGTRFVIAGEEAAGPDAVTREWLARQDGVEYVGRLADVRPLLAEADLFLFPSFYREGVPRVLLEAAATGLPAVAFDVPGVREAVRDGETGYLVPDRDVDALTGRVCELLADGARREAMGRAARAMAEASFDIRVIEKQYLALYRELGVAP